MQYFEMAALSVIFFWESISDIRKREICMMPAICFMAAGILFGIIRFPVLYAAASLVPAGCWIFFSRMTGGSLGYGDGIMLCVLGSWIGLYRCLTVLGIAVLLTCLPAVFLFFRKGKHAVIPFVPFLAAGYLIERLM